MPAISSEFAGMARSYIRDWENRPAQTFYPLAW